MKIISGGQTGIDRAALDAAIEMGVDYGGWCPKGGWAEDFANRPACSRGIRFCGRRHLPSRYNALNGMCGTPTG